MPPSAPAPSRPGFTLIEALAALLLVAIVLPLAVRAVAISAQVGTLSDRRAEAMGLCELKLTEVMLDADWRFGDDAGEFSEGYGEGVERYQWVLLVDDWNDTLEFKQVTLAVVWTQRGREQAVELATVVYDTEEDA